MKLKWGEKKIKRFDSLGKKAEAINDWSWWALFIAVVIMEVIVILRILGKI